MNLSKIIIPLLLLVSCSPHYGRGQWMFQDGNRQKIVRTAKKYLGVKYRYGGINPAGFDCSGYVMYVYKKNGIDIPRAIQGQFYTGRRVGLRDAKPGDLVFFTTGRKRLSHVGIYLGERKFIHSPRTGKRISIASINNAYWKRRFIGVISILRDTRRYYSKRHSDRDTGT